jgi:hypothetical protein
MQLPIWQTCQQLTLPKKQSSKELTVATLLVILQLMPKESSGTLTSSNGEPKLVQPVQLIMQVQPVLVQLVQEKSCLHIN